ncbi:MAG: hypothetical protein M3Y42_20455, partial [Actinomycetota bacterium]|nr:hypothetical protein [Actinomycetota bacterium]
MTHRVQPRHAAPTRSIRDRLGARLSRSHRIASAGAIAAGVATLCLTPLGASAATAGAHDPFGYLDQASPAASSIRVQGWAADPDALSRSLQITFTIDATSAGQVLSSVPRPDASAARGAGPKAGFAATLPAKPGSHQVCATAVNVGVGANHQLGCLSVTVADPAAVHNPIGAVEHATVAGTAVTVTGWATDPDNLSQPLTISATVDAKPAKLTKAAVQARPDIAKLHHSGPNQGYLLSATVTSNGLHTVCVTAANLAAGANSRLGCSSVRIGPPPPTAAQIAAQSPSGA